ncbi:replication initiator [Streptomyces sp. NPDC050085]|uniref:replication initiator n=1 Tax=Streptomyces sp. NPDC050085 TaxID=3365600 RepID=UPI0037B4AB0E
MPAPEPRPAADLGHVKSPALRELLTHLHHERFDQVRNQVRAARGCTNPIRLAGYTETVHARTGRILHSFNTADHATGGLLVACNNRRASRCPSCSRTYAGDTYQLIKAGVAGGKNITAQVATHPRVFATLTAPSFGPVHGTTWRGQPRCRCGTQHPDNAPALGAPLDLARYDYTGAVLFNAHAGLLWGRFTTYLRRYVARLLDLTQKEAAEILRVSFAKVAEFQKRGVVHYHAIIRFDGPEGSTQPPPPKATAAVLTKAVKLAARHATLHVQAEQLGERTLRWGQQIDVRQITPDTGEGRLTAEAVAGYIAKYATKGAEDSGALDRPLHCRDCHGNGQTTTPAGHPAPCPTCDGNGREPLDHLRLPAHVRQMIRTCFDLATIPELAAFKLHKWAHMLGFRGHFSTKSRRYSTTLGALREERRAWRRAHHDDHLVLEDVEQPNDTENLDDVTFVVSDWTFLGLGYTPGEQLIAAQVRHEQAERQRIKSEGELWE